MFFVARCVDWNGMKPNCLEQPMVLLGLNRGIEVFIVGCIKENCSDGRTGSPMVSLRPAVARGRTISSLYSLKSVERPLLRVSLVKLTSCSLS